MEKLDGKSKDILKENIEKLKQIFPEIVSEGNIDFDKLKTTLGEYVDDREERYRFSWSGKAQAKRLAQTPSTGTLRPCKEESVDWDKTKNLFIEGDNLEVLKLLQKTYHKKIKIIYIDPPYNTGKDFIYKDDFKDNIKNYLELTKQVDDEGKKLSANSETSGRYHTDWLNMMYPRLKLAKNLLMDCGLIFISIDDHEINNLKKLCDDIFGEENFLAQLPTIMNLKGNNDEFAFAGAHEYSIVYAKNKKECKVYEFCLNDQELDEWEEDEYGPYKKGANLKATGQNAPRKLRPNLFYPIFIAKNNQFYVTDDDQPKLTGDLKLLPITNEEEMSWRWEKKKIKNEPHNVIVVGEGQEYSLYKKQRPSLGDIPSRKPKTIFYKPEYSSGNGTAEVKQIFGEKIFDNPKPKTLLRDFLKIGVSGEEKALVLDFFAGSAPFAQAVLEYKEGINFICVQIPEFCDPDKETGGKAIKMGLKKVSDIGKERIRRVIKRIESEQNEEKNKKDETLFENNKSEQSEKLDLGFKVFKLDSSNIKTWDSDFDSLEKDLLNSVDNIKKDRSSEDVLYEILLKYGLDLTLPIEERKISKKTVYSIGLGALIVCLDKDISLDVVEGIAKLKEELNPEVSRVVFSDAGFKDDVVKTNTVQILKQHGIDDVKSI